MNIPNEAADAAMAAAEPYRHHEGEFRHAVLAAVESAAPLIVAEYLDSVVRVSTVFRLDRGGDVLANLLERRSAELRQETNR